MQMNQDLLNAISIILTAMFSAVGTVVAKYYNQKKACAKAEAADLENEKDAKLANYVIDDVDSLIKSSIVAVENTLKKAILDGIASGDYTEDNLKALSATVLENVKDQMAESSMQTLQSIRKNVDSYLATRIEDMLTMLKKDPNVAVSKTVIPTKISEDTIDNHTGQTDEPLKVETVLCSTDNKSETIKGANLSIDTIPGAAVTPNDNPTSKLDK